MEGYFSLVAPDHEARPIGSSISCQRKSWHMLQGPTRRRQAWNLSNMISSVHPRPTMLAKSPAGLRRRVRGGGWRYLRGRRRRRTNRRYRGALVADAISSGQGFVALMRDGSAVLSGGGGGTAVRLLDTLFLNRQHGTRHSLGSEAFADGGHCMMTRLS